MNDHAIVASAAALVLAFGAAGSALATTSPSLDPIFVPAVHGGRHAPLRRNGFA